MEELNKTYKRILHLYNNLVVCIDLSDKKVKSVLVGSTEMHRDITYKEFISFFSKYYNLDDISKGKIDRFITNLKPAKEPFTVFPTFNTVHEEELKIEVLGYQYNDKEMVLSFNHKLENLDNFDSLTKIYTKSGIKPIIDGKLEAGSPFALILLDIDHFAEFNDTYGKIYGDIILLEVSAVIKDYIKNNGYVARIAGDRFLIVINIEDDFDFIHTLCTEFRNTVMNLTNHNIKQAKITTTIGCATFPHDATDYDTLFKKAKLALARGKNKGRNCFVIYTEKKCGTIENHKFEEDILISSNKENMFNIISGVYEILNRKMDLKNNFSDALVLIGNFFLLDRINIHIIFPDEPNKIYNNTSWINPRSNEKEIIGNVANLPAWKRSFDKTGLLKINQVESNSTSPIYDVLKIAHTSSIVAYKLIHDNLEYGIMRFEMCHSQRFWKEDEVAALNVISKIFTIIIKNRFEQIKYDYQLSYDKLTNIYNFSKWHEEIDYLLENRPNYSYQIGSLCINNFYQLTDKFGNQIGEYAVKAIAQGLQVLSEQEIFCRVNEDKFIVFFNNDNTEFSKDFFDSLNNYIHSKFPHANSFNLLVGVAKGNTNEDELLSVIDSSDLALKKATSDNTFVLFTEKIYDDQKIKFEIEMHQDEALQKNEYLLYLQPKINTKTNEIVGAEALVRWNYYHNQLLFHNQFIPLFEENGFITKLDLYMFEKVCAFQRKMLNLDIEPVTISVNLSMAQKNLENYLINLNDIREKYQIPANLLEIEITESTYIKNIEYVSGLIKKLKEYGYKISMDDFGSGYSSLSALATFDFDVIKLDKKFGDNIEGKNKIILSKIIELVNNLNITVLCEGVESKELIDFLQANGCHIVQGYFYDKPLQVDIFEEKYMRKRLNIK